MNVYILKIDQYHEPEYYAFKTRRAAENYVEQHMLQRINDDSDVNTSVIPLLEVGRIKEAMDEWSQTEGEYLSIFRVAILEEEDDLSDRDLAALRGKYFR